MSNKHRSWYVPFHAFHPKFSAKLEFFHPCRYPNMFFLEDYRFVAAIKRSVFSEDRNLENQKSRHVPFYTLHTFTGKVRLVKFQIRQFSAYFSNYTFSETIGWIATIQCRISILISRFVFEQLCFPFRFQYKDFFCKFCHIENFSTIICAVFVGGQLVNALSQFSRKCKRSAASFLCSKVRV